MIPRVVAVVGPTASGKSALALDLARRLGAEILSADSVQVYRGLDVGTAKPTAEERAAVPHHLVDVVDLDQQFSVADFVRLARQAVEDIWARGRLPLVVGGTGLYVRALLEGYTLPPAPPDPRLRTALEALPSEELLEEIARRDPATAASIDRRNRRRLVRALEIMRQTGRPLSQLRGRSDPGLEALKIGLHRPRAALVERIDRRVEEMLRQGWLEEVRSLAEKGYGPHLRRLKALGYPELLDVVEGRRTLAEAVEAIKVSVRRYARRQMVWFRAEPGIRWVEAAEVVDCEPVLSWILAFAAGGGRDK